MASCTDKHPLHCADCGEVCYPLDDDFVCSSCGWSQNEYFLSAQFLPLEDIETSNEDFSFVLEPHNSQILDSNKEFTMQKTVLNKFVGLFRSRKFWAAAIGLIFLTCEEYLPAFPFTSEQVANAIYLLIAYIVGVAIDDAGQGIGGQAPF